MGMDWPSIEEWVKEYYGRLHALRSEDFAFWAVHVVFTWRWWLKIAALIVPWVLWIIVRKKGSSHRLLAAGIFVSAISIFLDEVGTMLGLWFYSAKLLPFLPGNTVYNIATLPVATMLFIQWFPKVKPIYKAVLFAALGAFVAMPMLDWIGYYENLHWAYWFSFPVLFAMYIIANWLASGDRFEKMAGFS
jgi:hypothetical protein